MTDEPFPHPTEPAADPLDERLSAALDGEPSPEPDEPGIDADVDPGQVEDRRRALAEARDLLAVAPPPLDDITRRRIIRAAVAERPHGKARDLTWLNRVGTVAAVLAVLVVCGLAIKAVGNSSSDDQKASSDAKAGTSGTTIAPVAAPFNLDDVSDPAVLKRRVTAALGAQAGSSTTAVPQTSASRGNGPEVSGDNSLGPCLSTITVSKGSAAPRVLADATYNGTPAIVAIAGNDSGTAVYVLATSDCRLLTYQFLKE